MPAISTLLVVPDEVADGPVSALEETDCAVTTVESATAALAELANGTFDCVVSEYGLPGDDGLSLLSAIRETDPDVPFVMFTATSDETIASEALLSGADRYVPKNGAKSLDRLQDCVTEVTDQSTAVESRTDRHDGTPFWNERTITPIYDDDGSVTRHAGFQSDSTDRTSAERVLNRVDGLLDDIATLLSTERDRRLVEDRICTAISDLDGYVGSWLGRTNAAETRLQLTAAADVGHPVDTELELDAVPDAITDAIDSDDAQYCDGCHDSRPLGPASIGARRLLVVPLSYGRRRHGLLGVYATKDALNSRERRLFTAIGTMIASGLNAIETTSLLTGDRVTALRITIDDDRFPLSAIADRLDTEIEYVGLKRVEREATHELYIQTSESTARSPTVLTAISTVETTRTVAQTESASTVAVTITSATPFPELAQYGVTVDAATADADRTTLQLVAPAEHDVRPLVAILESHYDGVTLRSQRERDRHDWTPNEFAARITARLTDRQQTSLETAYLNGYFEWPRPVDGTELAETMDISRQTFHQHLRAAERKLVDGYFQQELPN